MKKIQLILIASLMGCFFTPVWSQSNAGYFDLKSLTEAYGEPKVEVNLNSEMLSFISSMSNQDSPELSELLEPIISINVFVYNTKGKVEKALNTVDAITKLLRQEDWKSIININEDNEKIRIFVKYAKEKIEGLMLMVLAIQIALGYLDLTCY